MEYEREGIPTKRVKLLTVPYSQNTVFGLTDVQQMIAEMKSTSARGGKVSKGREEQHWRACVDGTH